MKISKISLNEMITNKMKNTSKPVLITGCSSGIGLSAAKYLQQQGFRVIASVRNKKDIGIFSDLDIECIQLDLTDEDSINSAVNYIKEYAPNIYGIVNNGAYGQPGAVEDLSRDALIEQFQTNVFGTHSLTQKLIPLLRKNNQGRIIQISSILGFVGAPMRGAYNASKYALEGLSDTLRIELKDTGIKVSIIQPGPIESQFRPNAYKAFEKHIDIKQSQYSTIYDQVYDRLHSKKKARFTLPADAVSKRIFHALSSKKPKIRYWVTVPTIVMGVLTKICPEAWRDKLIGHQSN